MEHDPPEPLIPSIDVCGFCSDSECDGIGCIASLNPDDPDDHPLIEELHDLLRAGAAWRYAMVLFTADPAPHGRIVARSTALHEAMKALAAAENR